MLLCEKVFNLWLLSSADNLGKQFVSRTGPTECRSWSGSKPFDTLMVILKEFGWFWECLRPSHRFPKEPNFEFRNPLAQLHIHVYHIPKFQNNPFSGYWELVQTKFGWKEEEIERNQCLPTSFGRLNYPVGKDLKVPPKAIFFLFVDL